MNQFTNEELKNLHALVSIAPIKGSESLTVALLLQKITKLLTPEKEETEKKEK